MLATNASGTTAALPLASSMASTVGLEGEDSESKRLRKWQQVVGDSGLP